MFNVDQSFCYWIYGLRSTKGTLRSPAVRFHSTHALTRSAGFPPFSTHLARMRGPEVWLLLDDALFDVVQLVEGGDVVCAFKRGEELCQLLVALST